MSITCFPIGLMRRDGGGSTIADGQTTVQQIYKLTTGFDLSGLKAVGGQEVGPGRLKSILDAVLEARGDKIQWVLEHPPIVIVTAEGRDVVRLEYYEERDGHLSMVYELRSSPLIGLDLKPTYQPDLSSPIAKAGLERYCQKGKVYPGTLPDELKPFYCYPIDSGHSILVALVNVIPEGEDPWGYVVPAPVKSVLRAGWFMRDGLPWCNLPYDPEVGLLVPDGDDEF